MEKSKIEEILSVPVLTEIPEDENVHASISKKTPLVSYLPDSPASIEFRRLAHYLTGKHFKYEEKSYSTIYRLFRWLNE